MLSQRNLVPLIYYSTCLSISTFIFSVETFLKAVDMDFEAAFRLRLFLGRSWIDVKSTLLADGLLLIPLHNKSDFSEFWDHNLRENRGILFYSYFSRNREREIPDCSHNQRGNLRPWCKHKGWKRIRDTNNR